MTNLQKLIDAVEAGGKWDGAIDFIAAEYIGLPRGMTSDEYKWMRDAHNGSLDAAKALHDALVPVWTRDIDATAPECGIAVTLHAPASQVTGENGGVTVRSDMACEARAWLIAILKAKAAQEAAE